MELIFIRHGQPEWISEGRNLTDPPLTQRGARQASALAERATEWRRPTEIVVSNARRARETAEPLCRALGIEPTVAPWFNEIRLPPEWGGAPTEVIEQLSRRARGRSVDEWWDGLPGGERFHDFYTRITSALAEFLAQRGAIRPSPGVHPSVWNITTREHRIVFVGHAGSNSTAMGFLLGLEPVPWPWERLVSYHASLSRLKPATMLGGHIFGLRSLSDLSHLSAELQTR